MKLQIVPAHTGAKWFWQGIQTFFRQPIGMGAMFLTFIIVISLPSIVPVIGFALALALVPMATVGIMAGARTVDEGRFPRPGTLFVALRQGGAEARHILVLGAFYAVVVMGVIMASTMFDGGQFARLYVGSGSLTPELAADPKFRTAMWATMLMYLPVSVAFWHAPALVHWHAVAPLKSVFFSIVAILRNAGAFLVYGALWVLLSIFASVMLLLLALITRNDALVSVFFVIFGLMIATMFFTSLWFTFRDSFHDSREAAEEETAEAQA